MRRGSHLSANRAKNSQYSACVEWKKATTRITLSWSGLESKHWIFSLNFPQITGWAGATWKSKKHTPKSTKYLKGSNLIIPMHKYQPVNEILEKDLLERGFETPHEIQKKYDILEKSTTAIEETVGVKRTCPIMNDKLSLQLKNF